MTTFKSLELSGWSEKAANYDEHFADITRQAIDPILDLAGPLDGASLLDVGCGTGDLAKAALARGASVSAIDFAPKMIEIARAKVPGASFHVGDGEDLDFPDGRFDTVVCAFGLWHMPKPDKAMAEAFRVLKPGGRYVYASWLPPEQGFDLAGMIAEAIEEHGTEGSVLPPAPPPFRLVGEEEAEAALKWAGFESCTFSTATATKDYTSGEHLLEATYKSIVRTPMLIDAQPPETREKVKQAIIAKADSMLKDGRITLRWPFFLGAARKAN